MAIRRTLQRKPPKPHQPVEDGLCTIPRAAEYLSVSQRTVKRLVQEGALDSVKIGQSRRIKWPSLRQYAGVPAPKSTMHDMIEDIVRAVVRELQSTRK